MRKWMILMTMTLSLTMVTGCKEYDTWSELEEIERLIKNLQIKQMLDSLGFDSIPGEVVSMDSTIVKTITLDSIPQNMVKTIIQKHLLEGHEYWTITAAGKNMGGTGITHSESCWCKRRKQNAVISNNNE